MIFKHFFCILVMLRITFILISIISIVIPIITIIRGWATCSS